MKFDTVKLGDLLDLLTDYHANGAYQKLKENVELLDVPDYAVMIRTTNFEQNEFSSSLKYISKHAYNFLAKSKVYAGDIIMNKIANAGSSYLMPELNIPVSLAMNLFLLRIDPDKANPIYVYIYLKINEAYVKNFANGSVTKTITKEAVRNLDIRLPERLIQDEIVKIYSSLSGKIELNRQINQTLEQMAQAIFKSWFVDFDPVRAKMEGRDTGLPAHIADLFPDELEESELGSIPKGWCIKSLDEIANYLNGLAMQKFPAENESEILPVIKIAQLKKGDTVGADIASSNIKQEYIVEDGDVLFSWSGSLEVDIWCGGRGALNQHLFKVTSNDYSKWFYLYWTKYHLEKFQAIAAGKAVTMGHIQRKHLTEAKCIVPDEKALQGLDSYISSLIEEQINRRLEMRSLSDLRDSLLPKLFSGEVSLSRLI